MVCRLVRVKVKILRSTVMLSSVIAETVNLQSPQGIAYSEFDT